MAIGIRKQWHRLAWPFFFIFVLFYLSFHAVSGDRGVYAMFKEKRKIAMLKDEISKLRAEREMLERRTHLLNAKSLDLDMLDEQAHRVLGLAGHDEIMIFAPQQK